MQTTDLKKAGLKVTLPRMKILELLAARGDRHMTAEDIYRALSDDGEDIGLATVYRVLNQFVAADLVVKHAFEEGGQAVYEINDGDHHDHMVRVDTGEIIEFHSEEIERLQAEIVAQHGFVLEDHSLILYVRPK